MRAANFCVFQVSESELLEAAKDPTLDEMDEMTILDHVWAATVSHEIGHNLGLRHNFEASYDKANWTFDKDDLSQRNYSSVMDYISDEFIKYDGYGPQDIAALRAAYAGVVELNSDARIENVGGKDVVGGPAGNLDVVSKKFVKIDQILQALGATSWTNVDSDSLGKLPLKKYRFCSDEDVGESPACNRFDMGTNPSEVVEEVIKNYRELYALRNFPGTKLNFAMQDTGAYVGRLFSKLTPVRQFLEETFYQLIKGADEAIINEHVDGVVKGLFFFHEILRTPDVSTLAVGNERFTQEELSVPTPDGKTAKKVLTVESKALVDQKMDDQSNRMRVRGIELDKAVALILLTERDLGINRYEEISLRISYPDFERMVLPNVTSPLQLPTVGLLAEAFADNIQPSLASDEFGALPLPPTYKAESRSLIRSIALQSAILSLDVDGIEAGDNNSALFRVLNDFKAPAKTTFIQQPGSANDLKYWALDKAAVSSALIGQGAVLANVRALATAGVQKDIEAWFQESLKPTAPNVLPDLEKKLDKELASLPENAGPRTMKELSPYLNFVYQTAAQLQNLSADPQTDKRLLQMEIERVSTMTANLAKAQPSTGLAMSALDGADLGLAMIDSIKPARVTSTQEGMIFQNVSVLSSFLMMTHPEYHR